MAARTRFFVAASAWNRRRKVKVIARFVRRHDVRSVLLVGGGEGAFTRNLQLIEYAVASSVERTVATDLIPRVVRWPWPYVCADALALPFRDSAFDLVLSNAVVEHVGDESAQTRFVAEHARVGRTWIVSTPNRWFPLESHTYVAFLHWSRTWRARQRAFTRLLSHSELRSLLPAGSAIRGWALSPTFVASSHPLS